MAATVLIREKNGAGETASDKTAGTVRMKTADDAAVDNNNPITVPGAGSNWSFEKWLRLQIGGVGPSVEISNLTFYTDGGNGFGTGISLHAKSNVAFSTPALGSSAVGYADAFSYTSGSPLSLGAGPYSSINTDMGDYLILLLQVASTAASGALTAETLTFGYDEI